MFKMLMRIVMFIIGMLMILDAGLPTANEDEQVDLHTSSTSRKRMDYANINHDTSYSLSFAGGRSGACSVGYSAYEKLLDGDKVNVQTTRIFRSCIRITRGEETVYQEKYWKIMTAIGGILIVAGALGWIKSDEYDD